MNFDAIKIDLLFAWLALEEIPENFNLRDDMLLKRTNGPGWDENGLRATRKTGVPKACPPMIRINK
jgi:poly(A) polymerase Pap1